MQADELEQWKAVMRYHETSIKMYESSLHKKGMSADYKRVARASLAAHTCARDALARKVTKFLLEGDPSA